MADRYVVTHSLRLDEVPSQQGEVKFHAAYAINSLKPLRWERIVRRAGQKTLLPVDRNPHATIQSLTQSKWFGGGYDIQVGIKHPPRKDGQVASVSWNNIEIVDDQGRVCTRFDGFVGGTRRLRGSKSLTGARFVVSLFKPTGSEKRRSLFTLRGMLSVNDNWPQPFSIKLAPR